VSGAGGKSGERERSVSGRPRSGSGAESGCQENRLER